MSVILDALRKLDREKSSRRKGTANIAVEIVRPDLTRPRRRIPIYIVTLAVAAIAAAAITYGVMSEFGFLSKSSPPAAKTAPVASQQVAPASPGSAVPSKLSIPTPAKPPLTSKQIPPAPPESTVSSKKILSPASVEPPAATQQVPRASVPTVPVHSAQDEMGRISPKIQSPAEKQDRLDIKIPVESKIPATPSPSVVPKELDTTPKKTAEPTPNISATNPASLKLSAIAWFEDPQRRFAMINGIMATEGSFVDGVKVVEINPTSVRLLHDGQYFEISMSK
jgi:general secretion pathway protein B